MAQTLVSRCDPVDSTFSLPFLAQLGDYLQPFAGTFPDWRLFGCFAQAVKGVIAASVPIVSRMAAAVLQSQTPSAPSTSPNASIAGSPTLVSSTRPFSSPPMLKPAPSSRTKRNRIPPF